MVSASWSQNDLREKDASSGGSRVCVVSLLLDFSPPPPLLLACIFL